MSLWKLIIAFFTLSGLEILLGIDNIVFIAIFITYLPEYQQLRAQRIGLFLAMFMRILLLISIAWIMKLTEQIFSVLSHSFSIRDLILLSGGLFLLAKATIEIHKKIEFKSEYKVHMALAKSYRTTIIEIALMDIIFSLDSVITAVGMVDQIGTMIAAIIMAMIIMMYFADQISLFIRKHAPLQMLALAFLILIGVFLVAEGLGKHIDRGYIYFAIGFSLGVEILNIRMRKAETKGEI